MIVAHRQEAVVVVPVVVEVVEVQLALGVILVEDAHVAIAVDLGNGIMCDMCSKPPPLKWDQSRTFLGLYRIRNLELPNTSHQLSLIFYFLHTTHF